MKKPSKWNIILLVLIFLSLVLFVIDSQTHFSQRLLDKFLYDNYHHYLSCEELPTLEEAQRVLDSHQATIDRIIALDPQNVTVQLDSSTCPSKGSITIMYPSSSIRKQIETILGGKTFFGIPLNLINY